MCHTTSNSSCTRGKPMAPVIPLICTTADTNRYLDTFNAVDVVNVERVLTTMTTKLFLIRGFVWPPVSHHPFFLPSFPPSHPSLRCRCHLFFIPGVPPATTQTKDENVTVCMKLASQVRDTCLSPLCVRAFSLPFTARHGTHWVRS